MGEIVNLHKARKARANATAKTEAAANRVTHGLTKDQKDAARRDRKSLERKIDAHKIED